MSINFSRLFYYYAMLLKLIIITLKIDEIDVIIITIIKRDRDRQDTGRRHTLPHITLLASHYIILEYIEDIRDRDDDITLYTYTH